MTAATRLSGEAGGPGEFVVPSKTFPGETWRVLWLDAGSHSCSCQSYQYRQRCRHVNAVALAVEAEDRLDRERSRVRCAAIAAELDRAVAS